MRRIAAVALGGALVGALVAWALRSEGADVSESPTARVDRARPTAAERAGDEPGAPPDLAECRRVLFQKEAELRGAQTTAARAVTGPRTVRSFDDEDEPPTEEAEAATAPDAEERRRYREARAKVRDAVVEQMGITEEEERALADVMCPQRDNERQLMSEFAAGRLDAEALFRSIAEERATSTEGMRRSLGSGRFRRLQRVGALSLLAPRLCGNR